MPHRSSSRQRRRHRRARDEAPLPDINVGTFTDALAEAAALLAESGRAFCAYLVDPGGQVIGGWALTAPHHQLEELALMVFAGDAPLPGTGVLLLSSDPDDDQEAMQREPEENGIRWESLRRAFARRGYHLWDWIHAGDDAFRSMHFSEADAGDWPAAPTT